MIEIQGKLITNSKLIYVAGHRGMVGSAIVRHLLGDLSKAKQKFGWVFEISSQAMCKEIVVYDLAQAKQHALLEARGYQINLSAK